MEKITALYTRVSTEMQREKGESIANQKSRLIDYCKEKGYSYKVYEDAGFSAKDTNRPALKLLIEDIKDGKVASVYVTKLDRITRSIGDLIYFIEIFEKYNVSFKSITQTLDTSTAMGRMFVRLLGEFAQLEREMVSERVGEDMKYRAKNGKWNGGVVPFGYKNIQKKLVVNPEEAEILKKIYQKYLELESLRGVVHWLNSNNYRTRHGMTWAATSISRLLTNPIYIGKTWYGKRITSKMGGKLKKVPRDEWIISNGIHQSIISEALFDKVQIILKRQTVEPRRKGSIYLLSGLVFCGKCGSRMNGVTYKRSRKNPKDYAYYRCNDNLAKGRSVCSGVRIEKDTLENIIVESILKQTENDKFTVDIKKALDTFNNEVTQRIDPMREERGILEAKNQKFEIKKQNLLSMAEDGVISKEIYSRRIYEIDKEYEQNQTRIFELEAKLNDNLIDKLTFESVYDNLLRFRENWKLYDDLSKKDLLWSLVSKAVVSEDKVKIELFFMPGVFPQIVNASLSLRLSWR